MKTKVFSILADNTSGVLSRVSGLFNRRGFNIDSFTAGETEDPTISRMTVVAKGDDLSLDQIQKQLAKLEDVREVKELKAEHSICRELDGRCDSGGADRTDLSCECTASCKHCGY